MAIANMFIKTRLACAVLAAVVLFTCLATAQAQDGHLRDEALAAMRRASNYYASRVASHGGYVYYYTPDLSRRWGEGEATKDQIWVQPPGTPAVGLAYLAAYRASGVSAYLNAAKAAGEALIYGQLQSGGWTNCVDFHPRGDKVARYRNGRGKGKDNSTLDDGITQTAIRFLMRLDQALEFKDRAVSEAVQVALDALIKAQYPNGGFPQVWTGPVPSTPVVKASFPTYDWRSEGRVKNYWDMYTLNDGVCGHVADVLIEAGEIYKPDRYKAALRGLGDFLILAQMPDPQPGWAQQYSYQMHPIWARRFEPPAVTGGESQDAAETLLKIYQATGDKKYLEPISAALEWLKRSLLPDGRLARYYELQTNRPLYMTRRGDQYTLTYDDSDLPNHYGWKQESRIEELRRRYRAAVDGTPLSNRSLPSEDQVRRIIGQLDREGRWMSVYAGERLVGQPKFRQGERYLACEVFCRNLELLSQYVAASGNRH